MTARDKTLELKEADDTTELPCQNLKGGKEVEDDCVALKTDTEQTSKYSFRTRKRKVENDLDFCWILEDPDFSAAEAKNKTKKGKFGPNPKSSRTVKKIKKKSSNSTLSRDDIKVEVDEESIPDSPPLANTKVSVDEDSADSSPLQAITKIEMDSDVNYLPSEVKTSSPCKKPSLNFCPSCFQRFEPGSSKKNHVCLFKCDECGRVCKNQGALTNHLKYHVRREKPYEPPPPTEALYNCQNCTRTFRKQGDLRMHSRRAHQAEIFFI